MFGHTVLICFVFHEEFTHKFLYFTASLDEVEDEVTLGPHSCMTPSAEVFGGRVGAPPFYPSVHDSVLLPPRGGHVAIAIYRCTDAVFLLNEKSEIFLIPFFLQKWEMKGRLRGLWVS